MSGLPSGGYIRGPAIRLISLPAMKELIVVRHAKSDWGDSSLDDHDRPLNRRGESDAPRMARALAKKLAADVAKVDAMVTSTALRARTTAEIFARELDFSEAGIERRHDGYLASSQEWIRIISGVDEGCQRVIIFGHNPGLHILVNDLLRNQEAGIDQMPTCAVVRIAIESETWGALGAGDGRLIDSIIPRDLS